MEPQKKQEPYNISIRFYKELAMSNQTTKCSLIAPIASTTEFDFESCSDPSNDLSFEVELHRENVEVIRLAVAKYLQECLIGEYNKDLGFKDTNLYLYKQRICLQREGRALDMLISQNIMFKEQTKKDIFSLLKEEQNLARFLKQIPQIFGLTVGQELTFIIYQILKEKKQKYKKIVASPPSIIPKFNCFQGFQNQIFQQHYGQCPIYEQINVQEVTSFADKDLEEIAKNLYFEDNYIKILNLKQITVQCNPQVDLIKQFTNLVKQISKSVFLTLAGATDSAQTFTSLFDLSKEISLPQISEIIMSANKSLVRPPVQLSKDQAYDSISKKVKL